jgi:hypothetical protein
MRRKSITIYKKSNIRRFIFFILFLLLTFSFCIICNADEIDLAKQYSPIFYFEKEEETYPVNVSYHIDNSHLYQFTGDEPIPIEKSTHDLNLSEYNSMYYLDNIKGTINDKNIIIDYKNKISTLGYQVYYRIEYSGQITVVQFWMFYAFNDGELNQHEGDWEMVQVLVNNGIPTDVMYSQHHSGQRATWDQVERDGDHIRVYVARGSHANYLRSYSGKFGVANDFVGNNGKILRPTDYSLDSLENKAWIDFGGKWGEFSNIEDDFLGRAGPYGPKFRENGAMWESTSWGERLINADNNIFLIEWIIYNFVIIFTLISLIILSILSFGIYKRYKNSGLGPRVFSILYIDGLNLKSIGNILCIIGLIIAIFSLFNPWYFASYNVSGDSNFVSFQTEGMTDLLNVDGIKGIQITIPGQNGPTPMGTVTIPFSLLIGIGIIFTILATIGISRSVKLGQKYIWRGIKLLFPIILIIILFMIIGSLIAGMIPDTGNMSVNNAVTSVLNELSSSPLGGEGTIPITSEEINGRIDLQWGLGQGGQFLLISGILLIISGALEIIARSNFFESKKIE